MIDTVSSERKTVARLRNALLIGVILNLVLIGLRVLLYLPLLQQEGSGVYVVEPIVLLLGYAGIIWWSTVNAPLPRRLALRTGTVVGLLTGSLWVVNLTIETFVEVKGVPPLFLSAPFMLSTFLLWGIAGLLGTRQTHSFVLGILAAMWSALVGILILVTFGWLLTYTALPRLENLIANDPDFLRSHWTDRQAFAIANALDSGFSHLLGALIIGATVGLIGSVIGKLSLRGKQRQHTPI